MKTVWKVAAGILAALICAAMGAYVLWQFHTTAGLFTGVALVILAVAIALPTRLHDGILTIRDNATTIIPVVQDAIAGGRRHTDPPVEAVPPTKPGDVT